jgi:hypothetical protein
MFEQFKVTDIISKIDRLHEKALSLNKIFRKDIAGVSIADVYIDKKRVSKILLKELSQGSYKFSPPLEKKIKKSEKERTIYSYTVLDNIVQSLFFEKIMFYFEKNISKNVFSYRKGRTNKSAVLDFQKFLKKNKNEDLFVFRCDIKNYTDSIPIKNSSLLWGMIENILKTTHFSQEENIYIYESIKAVLRPIIRQSGVEFQKIVGIPTGCIMSTLVANLYLKDIDNLLSQDKNAFYARFGDDFLFAHKDFLTFDKILKELYKTIDLLSLEQNEDKRKIFYFTKAGKSISLHIDGIDHFVKGTNKFDFLGYNIHAEGGTSAKSKVFKRAMKHIKRIILNLHKEIPQKKEDKAYILCKLLNHSIYSRKNDPSSEITNFIDKTTNIGALKTIDYEIAHLISQKITGIKGVKSWRHLSYKELREKFGLKSFCKNKRE